MSVHPLPDAAEIRDNATFEALLWALSRPGEIRRMPEAGQTAIALALVDRECVVHTDDPVLSASIEVTGARRGPAEQADHAFLSDRETLAHDLSRLPAGSALYPDEGATVVVDASIGSGTRIALSGPGIETRTIVEIGGLPADFWAVRASRCRYPAGIDLFFVDGDRVVGIPRSTLVEVI